MPSASACARRAVITTEVATAAWRSGGMRVRIRLDQPGVKSPSQCHDSLKNATVSRILEAEPYVGVPRG
jgi:hypothetical protein